MQRAWREILFGSACALVLLVFGCQMLTDAHERLLVPDGERDSAPSGGAGGSGGSSSGGQSDSGASAGESSAGGSEDAAETEPEIQNCPESFHGPALVTVVSNGVAYCIDATEVTNADYALFLGEQVSHNQNSRCSWNADYRPLGGIRGADDDPVTNVDWCDAFEYCLWARKRLCGGIGGTGDPYQDFAVAEVDEWYNACSSGGVNKYPYGNEYSGGVCNGIENGAALKPVRAAEACVAGGVYDLSGNVAEWENACDTESSDPPSDKCRLRGGGYYDGAGPLACDADLQFARGDAGPDIGFRCCQGTFSP